MRRRQQRSIHSNVSKSRSRSPYYQRDDHHRGGNQNQGGHFDNRDSNPQSFTQIYIAKLHHYTREDDLRKEFRDFGEIRRLNLKKNYAFIDYATHEQAKEAIKMMHGKKFVNGEELVVEQSGNDKLSPFPN